MRKLVLFSLVATVMASLGVSCGFGSHTERIALPDTTSTTVIVPEITGNIADYFKVETKIYSLELTDTNPSMAVTLTAIKPLLPLEVAKFAEAPYITLLDAQGAEISDVKLVCDTTAANSIIAALKDTASVDVNFVSAVAVEVAERDSIALKAKNFRVVGNMEIKEVGDPAIDAELDAFEKTGTQLVRGSYQLMGRVSSMSVNLRSKTGKMTQAQKERYLKLHRRFSPYFMG